jgi:uncharacterized RDD family membrane protein YckC
MVTIRREDAPPKFIAAWEMHSVFEAMIEIGQDSGMYCANCGTETRTSHCGVCGAGAGRTWTTTDVAYAGWWQRVGATIIDNLILFIPTEIVIYAVSRGLNYVVADLAAIVVQGFYMFILLTKPAGQTIGNRAVGTRVRNAADAGPISPNQVLRRLGLVALYSFLIVFGAGAVTLVGLCAIADSIFPLFTPRKQTLHDIYARTIVVRK